MKNQFDNYFFVHGSIVYFDGTNYATHDPRCRQLVFITPFSKRTTLCAPLQNVESLPANSFPIDNNLISIAPLPYFVKTKGFLKGFPFLQYRLWKAMKECFADADHICIRAPDPLTFMALFAARTLKKNISIHVTGDVEEVLVSKTRGLKKRIAMLVGAFFNRLLCGLAKNDLILVWGTDLLDTFRKANKVHSVFTCLVAEKDIRVIDRSAHPPPYKVLYSGFVVENKGIAYLIDAIAEIRKTEDVRLTIIGFGPYEDYLRQYAKDRNIDSAVKFPGFISNLNEIFEIMASHDILVLPSLSEGIPKVLLESMAVGLPIVSTDVGGIRNIIHDGENGILVQSRSASEITNGLNRIIHDEELRNRLVAGGYQFIRDHCAEKMAEEMMTLTLKHASIDICFPTT